MYNSTSSKVIRKNNKLQVNIYIYKRLLDTKININTYTTLHNIYIGVLCDRHEK